MIPRYTLPPMEKLWSEEAKYGRWLEVELAVCRAWRRAGRIPAKALREIESRARFDVDRILEIEKTVGHHVIAFLTDVNDNVGPASRFIHLGLTSEDVVDTSLILALKQAATLILRKLEGTIDAAAKIALKYKNTPMIGRTHGIHAEPTTFGLKFLVYHQELLRTRERIRRARRAVSVGKIAGPVGTLAQVPPAVEADALRQLGLKPPVAVTQVIQRDRHAEYVAALAICGATLEKIALEIRALQRTEVGEAAEPFRQGQKGSSSMPHKRNPELCERICGLARLLRGWLVAALENVALWHERDISHSSAERIIFPDATTTVYYMLDVMNYVLEELDVYPRRMKENLETTRGLIFSGRVLVELAAAGASREEAYDVVQRQTKRVAAGRAKDLRTALAPERLVKKYLTGKKLSECFRVGYFLRHVDDIFARAGLKGP
ncbi:MAG: adenylosuccinate lyase [bacterium]